MFHCQRTHTEMFPVSSRLTLRPGAGAGAGAVGAVELL